MSPTEIAASLLVVAGAAVMAWAWCRVGGLIRSAGAEGAGSWRLLRSMMAGFLLGYLGAVGAIATGSAWVLTVLVSVVFLGGAAFVLLVVEVGRRSLTELSEARDEAMTASQAKSAFLANMSHDLRTPLNAILGYAELVEESAVDADDEETAADMRRIHTAAGQLLTLINGILDLSKVEAGKLEVRPESVRVVDLLAELETTFQHLRGDNELSLESEVDTLETDRGKLLQILVNLVGNACKFTREGQVGLRVEAAADGVAFRVWDTGDGIPADKLDSLFDPFVQVKPGHAEIGTGLGLALVRRLSELLGGRVEVHSVVGEGSEFTVWLPSRPLAT